MLAETESILCIVRNRVWMHSLPLILPKVESHSPTILPRFGPASLPIYLSVSVLELLRCRLSKRYVAMTWIRASGDGRSAPAELVAGEVCPGEGALS